MRVPSSKIAMEFRISKPNEPLFLARFRFAFKFGREPGHHPIKEALFVSIAWNRKRLLVSFPHRKSGSMKEVIGVGRGLQIVPNAAHFKNAPTLLLKRAIDRNDDHFHKKVLSNQHA